MTVQLPDFVCAHGQLPVSHQIQPRLKRVHLVIRPEGILVKTPASLEHEEILTLLQRHQRWLARQLAKLQSQGEFQTVKAPAQIPDTIWYLGQAYALQVAPARATEMGTAQLAGESLQLFLPEALHTRQDLIQQILRRFFEAQARNLMHDRLMVLSAQMGLTPAKVRYKWLKSRWGSCSSQQNINLNCRAIQLPLACIDSILVHELAHLRHLNHGRQFWELVHQHQPDYAEQAAQIQQLSPLLL